MELLGAAMEESWVLRLAGRDILVGRLRLSGEQDIIY